MPNKPSVLLRIAFVVAITVPAVFLIITLVRLGSYGAFPNPFAYNPSMTVFTYFILLAGLVSGLALGLRQNWKALSAITVLLSMGGGLMIYTAAKENPAIEFQFDLGSSLFQGGLLLWILTYYIRFDDKKEVGERLDHQEALLTEIKLRLERLTPAVDHTPESPTNPQIKGNMKEARQEVDSKGEDENLLDLPQSIQNSYTS